MTKQPKTGTLHLVKKKKPVPLVAQGPSPLTPTIRPTWGRR